MQRRFTSSHETTIDPESFPAFDDTRHRWIVHQHNLRRLSSIRAMSAHNGVTQQAPTPGRMSFVPARQP